MSENRPNVVRAWWPAALGVLVIAVESTDWLSSRNTGGVLYALLFRLFGAINPRDFQIFHQCLRKAGHFVGYGVLSLLMLHGWRATLGESLDWLWRTARLAWLATAFVAALDEWHQAYLPSREGRVSDVVLDSAAALIFLWFAFLHLRRANGTAQTA